MDTTYEAALAPQPRALALAGVLSALLSLAGVVAATGLAFFFIAQ